MYILQTSVGSVLGGEGHRPLMDYRRTLDGTLIFTRTSLDTLSLERWPTTPYRLSTDTTVGRIHYYILKTSFVNIRAATKSHSTLAESSQIVKWTCCTMRIRGFVCRAIGNTGTESILSILYNMISPSFLHWSCSAINVGAGPGVS